MPATRISETWEMLYGLAAERGRDWVSVAIGLAIVALATGLLWSWLGSSLSSSSVGPGLGPFWLVSISVAAILLLVLATKLSQSHRHSAKVPRTDAEPRLAQSFMRLNARVPMAIKAAANARSTGTSTMRPNV